MLLQIGSQYKNFLNLIKTVKLCPPFKKNIIVNMGVYIQERTLPKSWHILRGGLGLFKRGRCTKKEIYQIII